MEDGKIQIRMLIIFISQKIVHKKLAKRYSMSNCINELDRLLGFVYSHKYNYNQHYQTIEDLDNEYMKCQRSRGQTGMDEYNKFKYGMLYNRLLHQLNFQQKIQWSRFKTITDPK